MTDPTPAGAEPRDEEAILRPGTWAVVKIEPWSERSEVTLLGSRRAALIELLWQSGWRGDREELPALSDEELEELWAGDLHDDERFEPQRPEPQLYLVTTGFFASAEGLRACIA